MKSIVLKKNIEGVRGYSFLLLQKAVIPLMRLIAVKDLIRHSLKKRKGESNILPQILPDSVLLFTLRLCRNIAAGRTCRRGAGGCGSPLLRCLFVFVALLLFAGCASSDRMMRLSPASARAYSAPDAKRLKSVSYRNMERPEVKNKTFAEENVINVWPFFLKNDYFHSILWPFIDYDQYGVAVRPFYNKEGDEHSILFPLAGWNSADNSGWVLNTFWSKDRLTVFPFYHHKPDYLYAFPVSRETYKNGKVKTLNIFPFSYFGQAENSDNYYYILLPFGGWAKDKESSYGIVLNTYWGKDYAGSVPFFHHDKNFYYYLLYWRNKKKESGGVFPVFYYSPEAWQALLAYSNEKRWGFFPLFAQNYKNDGGYFFPFYIYSSDEDKSFVNAMLLFNYYKRSNGLMLAKDSYKDMLVFPVYAGEGEEFKFLAGSVNFYFFTFLDKACVNFKNSFAKSDMKGVADARKTIGELLKYMKLDKEFSVPQNIDELNKFAAAFQQKFGSVIEKKSFSIFPFYGQSQNGSNKEWSLLWGWLHRSKDFQYYDWSSLPNTWGRNPKQILEEKSSRTLVLAQSSETLERSFKNNISNYEKFLWYQLREQVRDLSYCIEQDEFNLWAKDPKYKSSTAKQRESIKALADKLGIKLPELKTSAQCVIFCKEIEGMCLEYYRVDNTSLLPFFEIESGDKGSKFEIFPLFFTEKYKFSKYGEKDRTNVLLLCHNQTVKDKIPQGKLKEVLGQLNRFESALAGNKITHKLPQALKNANLSFAVPKNFRECHELRQKLYAMIPENTERVSTLLPFYYYSGNNVLDDSYLNILGIFYNGGHKKQDSWFNVLGFVARGFEEKDEEEFRILEFLYRSRRRGDEKDYLIFPFFYYRSAPDSSQFSFLHRIVNIEKSSTGTKGHIFYIPFGDEK